MRVFLILFHLFKFVTSNAKSNQINYVNYEFPVKVLKGTPNILEDVEPTSILTPKTTSSPTPYILLPVDDSVFINQEGLVNITCDKFTYNDIWTEGGKGEICVESELANHGSYTSNPGATATIKFIGKKFHILTQRMEISCNVEIRFDGELIATVNFNSNNGTRFNEIVFTSHEFEYGEHILELKHAGDNTSFQKNAIGAIYVDPLPSIGGFKLSYENFEEKVGEWTESTTTTPSTFTCSSDDCSGEFSYYGTRFLLTGVRSSTLGEFEIIIDDNEPILVEERQDMSVAQNNLPVILYQSDELEQKLHKIKIQRTNYPISLINLFYINLQQTESSKFTKSETFSFSNDFSESAIFTKSEKFTKSDEFTISQKFSASELFTSSSVFTSQTKAPNKISISKSFSITYVKRKSVSFSLSYSLSNILEMSYDINDETYTMFMSQTNYLSYFPYIIYYLSPSYLEQNIIIDIKIRKKISPEQLIGVVCGSTSVFFLILGIIIFAIQKKYELKNQYDEFNDISDSSNEAEIPNKIDPNDNLKAQNCNTNDYSEILI